MLVFSGCQGSFCLNLNGMMIKKWFLTPLALAICGFGWAQSGCPGCATSLPALPLDTIFLSNAPDGQAGQYYDEDISFRMPKTTTPVAANDPETPPGLAIQQITIASVTNLPPGLQWEASQLVFNPSEQTDGCVKFCGTPYLPGTYLVNVVISAQVFFVEQQSSFSFPIVIAPSISNTQGFSMFNDIGCGELVTSFNNLILSNTQAEFSYHWDFGNGNTTADPNPAPQTYSTPGLYEVNYQAIIDTVGYILTGVTIEEVGCSDLLSAPDLKIGVFDSNGTEIFLSDIISNASTPLSFQLVLPLQAGNYSLRVTDDDGGIDGADDICGVVNFNQLSSGLLPDDEMLVSLNIIHPIDTIRSRDTVIVLAQPPIPIIEGLPSGFLCEGDSVQLSVAFSEGLQWYRDSMPLIGFVDSTLNIQTSGQYWAGLTYENGCSAVSEPQQITFFERPEGLAFVVSNNLLNIFDLESLPEFYQISWLQNGQVIEGETMTSYCINQTGLYTLMVSDAISGCGASFSQQVTYNPNFPNCTTGLDEPLAINWKLYPNPSSDQLFIQGVLAQAGEIQIKVVNALGQELYDRHFFLEQGAFTSIVPVSQLPEGTYYLEWFMENNQRTFHFVKH